MGLFCFPVSNPPNLKEHLKCILQNLECYSNYCSTGPREGRFKDELGQTPPDYLVTDFAMKFLKEAIEMVNDDGSLR